MQEVPEARRGGPNEPEQGRSKRQGFTSISGSIGALIGIFGGISVLVAGVVCVILHYAISGDAVYDRVGTVCLIAAIPMLLIGSIFLDRASPSSK